MDVSRQDCTKIHHHTTSVTIDRGRQMIEFQVCFGPGGCISSIDLLSTSYSCSNATDMNSPSVTSRYTTWSSAWAQQVRRAESLRGAHSSGSQEGARSVCSSYRTNTNQVVFTPRFGATESCKAYPRCQCMPAGSERRDAMASLANELRRANFNLSF
jgi:hypothetical protein